jgi:cell envelope opacity-associated protein A
MKKALLAALWLAAMSTPAIAVDATAAKTPAKPAASTVDPAKEAEHEKEDIKRHRQMAAAHEAAAKCKEAAKGEDFCNAELAKACKGIAYGKFCGMKHLD